MAKGDKKLETRKRIIDAASRSFRKNGFAGIGVDGIAKEAGVTSGAFYSHLGSKQNAFDTALIAGLDEVIEAIPKFQAENKNWVETFSRYYLGQEHINDLSCGCAMTTLSPEVVKCNVTTHALYQKKMTHIVELIADGLINTAESERIANAWSLLGILIGGLTMARAVEDDIVVEKIASSIIATAISLAD